MACANNEASGLPAHPYILVTVFFAIYDKFIIYKKEIDKAYMDEWIVFKKEHCVDLSHIQASKSLMTLFPSFN